MNMKTKERSLRGQMGEAAGESITSKISKLSLQVCRPVLLCAKLLFSSYVCACVLIFCAMLFVPISFFANG